MGRSRPVDGLWEQVVSFENLWEAARLARRGKRFRDSTARFERHLGENLLRLRDELQSGTYQPGEYTTFTIYEPARRLISAAPYRDRVVHHALCRVIEPIFEKGFVFDSYANRKGKGTHAALDRTTVYARRFPYVMQGDVRLFFPSLDHEILIERLRRRIADGRVLALCASILANSNEQELVTGYTRLLRSCNTSRRSASHSRQRLIKSWSRGFESPNNRKSSTYVWANVYLDSFDHFVKDEQGVPGYARRGDSVPRVPRVALAPAAVARFCK